MHNACPKCYTRDDVALFAVKMPRYRVRPARRMGEYMSKHQNNDWTNKNIPLSLQGCNSKQTQSPAISILFFIT